MNRIQRIRHSLGALAGLADGRGAARQVAGDRREAMRHAGGLAVTGRRPFGVAVVLAAPLLFAGTANAIAAAGPAGNVPVVSAWNAAAPDTAWAAPLAGFPGETARTDGAAVGERVAQERARGRNAPVLVTTPTAPGMRRPAAPALAPTAVPRLGGVTPLQLNTAIRLARPPSPARFKHYPRAFIEWKLSAWPPQHSGRSGPPPPDITLISTAPTGTVRHYKGRQTLYANVVGPRGTGIVDRLEAGVRRQSSHGA